MARQNSLSRTSGDTEDSGKKKKGQEIASGNRRSKTEES